jgi:tryptophanyl-tRNA synthetase
VSQFIDALSVALGAIKRGSGSWGQFKPLFTEATIEALRPIQERYNALTGDRSQVEAVLRQGKEAAEIVAQQTLQAVKDALGFSQSL